MKYFEEIKRSMEMLAEDQDTLFIGQAVECQGTAMRQTLKDVAIEKLYEFPVAEEMQMGVSIGLALTGHIPISIYPRWNFLLCAVNQLVNHLDKLPFLGYNPGVIVRVGVGSVRPLDPQHQHKGNFAKAFHLMLDQVPVVELTEPEEIFPAYQLALKNARAGVSTLIVEHGDYYQEK